MYFVRRQRLPGLGVEPKKPRSQLDVYLWLEKIDSMSHSWPKSGMVCKLQVEDLQAKAFHLHRKFTRARHLWLSLRPDWSLMRTHMYTDWPGIYSYAQLNDRLFTNPAYLEWQQQGLYMA